MSAHKAPQAVRLTGMADLQAAHLSRLWVILAGVLLFLSAATMLVSLWPYYLQLSTPCDGAGRCFTPALFTHDVAVLAQYGISLTAYATLVFLIQFVANFGCLCLASILFWRRRSDPMALCTVAVLAAQPLTSGYLTAIIDLDGPWRVVLFVAALVTKVVIILFLALFPTGSSVPRGLRWFLPALITVVAAAVIIEAVDLPRLRVRIGIYSVETFWILSMLLVQLYRYRYVSSPDERRQTRWLMALLAVYFSYIIGFAWFIGTVGSPDGRLTLLRAALFVLLYLLQLAVVFGTAMALRQGLYNMSRVMAPAVVYALLTVCVVVLYVLLVGGTSLLLRPADNTFVSLLATGVVAMAFQPLRAALQRGVNQLIYGHRAEPYQVLVLLGARLGGALPAHDMLPTVAVMVRDTLRLPYVAVTRRDWESEVVVSVSGEPIDVPVALPLVFQHEQIGRVLVAQRAPDEPFSHHERRLLVALAQHISGKTVRNHITNVFAKLGVSEHSKAIVRARAARLE